MSNPTRLRLGFGWVVVSLGFWQKLKRKNIKVTSEKKFKKDTKKIANEDKLIISADITNNFYKLNVNDYDELLEKHITKEYKKADENMVDEITKDIA